jgi:tetratricopeptide (TPR) repeat protein
MHARPIVAGTLALMLIGGCTATRPLPTVREHGDRAFIKGDYAKAASDYQEYATRKPGEAEVHRRLADSLLKENQPFEALTHAQQAFDLRPGEPEYIETYAEALLATGKSDYLHKFLRSLAQDRGGVSDWVRLGRFTARMGDADGAEAALTTAATMDRGQTIEPQLALANLYRSIGATEREKERLRMALYIDPKNEAVMQRLRELGEIPGPSLVLQPTERD